MVQCFAWLSTFGALAKVLSPRITFTSSFRRAFAALALPALDFAAASVGIDARKVIDSGVLPVINSGIAHREAGVGQIGAGVTTAPMACFTAAVKALARSVAEIGRPT